MLNSLKKDETGKQVLKMTIFGIEQLIDEP